MAVEVLMVLALIPTMVFLLDVHVQLTDKLDNLNTNKNYEDDGNKNAESNKDEEN